MEIQSIKITEWNFIKVNYMGLPKFGVMDIECYI